MKRQHINTKDIQRLSTSELKKLHNQHPDNEYLHYLIDQILISRKHKEELYHE